jgi:glycogen debranching enzyme
VACSPQAWAAGAVFMFLQACLGLSVVAREKQVRLYHPLLPESLQHVEISDLRLGDSSVDLVLERHGEAVSVTVNRRIGDLEVVTIT